MIRVRRQMWSLVALLVIGVAGVVTAWYVLVHERFPVPFRSTYNIKIELQGADGVVPGLGQPVNVAGVQVGSIIGATPSSGLAQVTLQLNRHQVPRVYANADATLEPITPLGDVEIDLSPGGPPARPLPAGATLGIGETTSPVQLEDLLSNLDTGTRAWLSSFLASLAQGTTGRADDIRQTLLTLGPSAADLHEITQALATRRRDLAALVHNLAIVTRAASEDGQLSSVVAAGDQTLHALAVQDVPLRESIAQLPATLGHADTTLTRLQSFAQTLQPTLGSLMPAVARLPETLTSLRPFATAGTQALRTNVRPFVVAAQPLVSDLAPAVQDLSIVTPHLTSSVQVLDYFLNELAYNPGGKNQGYLYWLDWFVHNFNSLAGVGDAHGTQFRANVAVNCDQFTHSLGLGQVLETLLGVGGVC